MTGPANTVFVASRSYLGVGTRVITWVNQAGKIEGVWSYIHGPPGYVQSGRRCVRNNLDPERRNPFGLTRKILVQPNLSLVQAKSETRGVRIRRRPSISPDLGHVSQELRFRPASTSFRLILNFKSETHA